MPRRYAQAGEPHDGLSGQFLRELHAALVVGTIGLVLIDVRQLFGAAQRALFDLFDLSGVGIEAALVRWRQEMGRQAQGHHIFALGGFRPLSA